MFIIIGAIFIIIVIVLVFVDQRRSRSAQENGAALTTLIQSMQTLQNQSAITAERLAALAPVTQSLNQVQLEMRSVAERITTVEQNQNAAGLNLSSLQAGLAGTGSITSGLVETASAISQELAQARHSLTEMQAHAHARQDLEQQIAMSVRRLEGIIAGTHTKGAAGESILEAVLAQLPPDWQVKNFRVGNRMVEFGLRLPNGLIVPIDSKWPATGLLEQFINSSDPEEQQKIKSQIESAVLAKAKEVKKYLDPSLTVNFGIAAVPDAVFELCTSVHAQSFLQNVAIVSYSMLIPYLLLVFQTVFKASRNIDLEKLESHLKVAEESVRLLQEELEGRFAKAVTMLTNTRSDMSLHVSKISSCLSQLQMQAGDASPGLTNSEASPTGDLL